MASKSDAEQRPYFTVDNWAVLCKRIAAEDMDNVGSIFDMCEGMILSGE